MEFTHNDCKVTLHEDAGVIFAHFDLYGTFTVSDYRWIKRAIEFYLDDIGYVAVAPDESDSRMMRLVARLGFKPTNSWVLYENISHRRVYLCHPVQ